MPVELGGGRVALLPQLDARDIGQPHHRAVGIRLDHDLAELIGGRQPRLGADGGVQHLPFHRGQRTDLSRRDIDILRRDRRLDVRRHQLDGGELGRVQPDPHRIFRAEHLALADAADARDIILEIADQIVGDVAAGRLVGLVVQRDDQQEVAVRLGHGDALRGDRGRQPRGGLLNLVLNLDLRDVGIGPLDEGDGDRRRSRRVRTGLEILQAVDAGQLLLDHLRHAGLERFGRCSGIRRIDRYGRWRDIGILRDRQRAQADDPAEHDDDRDHPREDRAFDEEAADTHLSWWSRGWWCRRRWCPW